MLLRRLRGPTERALVDAQMTPADFDAVVLVGGATRSPMVRALVGRLFQKLPLVNIDPDTTVALGAATQAGLVRRDAGLKDVVMTDVSPYTLGVATLDTANASAQTLHVSPIIQRNAVVPISRTLRLTTVKDNQTSVSVDVYQGEHLRPENNVHLGSLDVTLPPKKEGEESIEVRFTYDINGALEVEVLVLSTQVKLAKIFRNASGLSEAELAARFETLSGLKLLPREQMENRVLLERAERLYSEQNLNNREMLRRAIGQFENDLADQTRRNVDEMRKEFGAFLDHFETSPFGNA
jgi:molecular chaperone HscC